jgi:hypothetical protein
MEGYSYWDLGPGAWASMNRTDEALTEARLSTDSMRSRNDEYWPSLRLLLRQIGIVPELAAVGELSMEQLGPFVIVVTQDERAFAIQLELLDPRDTSRIDIDHWKELERGGPDRTAYALPIYAALVILSDESSHDPVSVLVENLKWKSEMMQQDVHGDWRAFRESIERHGIDPTRCVLIDWGDVASRDQETVRRGWLMWMGSVYAFFASVDVTSQRVGAVTSWEELDREAAERQTGALLEAAVRIQDSRERDA